MTDTNIVPFNLFKAIPQKLFHRGDEESEGLAGAGLRGSQDIFSGEGLRNCRGLHGRRQSEIRGRKFLLQIGGDG